jgi:hypothetical protein
MRDRSDGVQRRDGQPSSMDTAPIDQALALSVALLLMVLAGAGKGRLEWRPRPWFRRKRRR